METQNASPVKEEVVRGKEFVRGIAICGDAVQNMKDKRFVILDGSYKDLPDLDVKQIPNQPPVTKEKLVLFVECLDNHSKLEYIPNMTSIKIMSKLRGYAYTDWFGHLFEWETALTKVRGQDKHTLYVKDLIVKGS